MNICLQLRTTKSLELTLLGGPLVDVPAVLTSVPPPVSTPALGAGVGNTEVILGMTFAVASAAGVVARERVVRLTGLFLAGALVSASGAIAGADSTGVIGDGDTSAESRPGACLWEVDAESNGLKTADVNVGASVVGVWGSSAVTGVPVLR